MEQAKLLQAPRKFRNIFELAAKRGYAEGFTHLATSLDAFSWTGYRQALTDFNVWDLVKVVMTKGGGPDRSETATTSPVDTVRCQLLSCAIQLKDVQRVKSMLDLSIDMGKDLARDVAGSNGSYVHVAAFSGSTEIMQMLIDKGLPLDVVNMEGMTPLHYACRTGTLQVVEMILGAGVKVDAKARRCGSTPLMMLLKFGAWRTCDSPGETFKIMQALVAHGASVHTKDASGHQVIHYAMLTYDSTVINALLDLGANPEAMANGLVTPLHALARGYCWSINDLSELKDEGFRRTQHYDYIVPPHAQRAAAELIIRASPEGYLAVATEDGDSALALAIQTQNWVVAQALHRSGASFLRSSQPADPISSHVSECIDHDLYNVSNQGFYELTRLLLQHNTVQSQERRCYHALRTRPRHKSRIHGRTTFPAGRKGQNTFLCGTTPRS